VSDNTQWQRYCISLMSVCLSVCHITSTATTSDDTELSLTSTLFTRQFTVFSHFYTANAESYFDLYLICKKCAFVVILFH